MFNIKKISTMSALVFGLTASPVLAASSPILLQNSQSYAIENQFKAFRVPVKDSKGVVHYLDVTVSLTPTAAGGIASAAVTASPSLNIPTGVITPGTYKSADGKTTCTIRNVTLTNGRIQSYASCAYTTFDFEFSVATGLVTSDHPYFNTLNAYGIPKLGNVNSQTWGLELNNEFQVGRCLVNYNAAVGATTDGSQINLSVYGTSAQLLCGATLIKQ